MLLSLDNQGYCLQRYASQVRKRKIVVTNVERGPFHLEGIPMNSFLHFQIKIKTHI